MEKKEFIIIFLFTSIVLVLIGAFLLFALVWYRKKANMFILDRDNMKNLYEKQLLQTRLEIQEQTLNHISQEIHDNVGQQLSLTKIQLNIIEVSEGLSKEVLQGARESLSTAIIDLRDIAKSLSSDRIRNFNLTAAIEEELMRIRRCSELRGTLTIEGTVQVIAEERKLILFRIIQEGLQNIIKHAHATDSSVDLVYEETGLRVFISDNGVGFDLQKAAGARSGLGLQNITSRASIAGGHAFITSEPGKGTLIKIVMPYV